MTSPDFIHRFVPAEDATAAPLLLLHGTGGDESDLLGLGRAIAPGAALLSPRGKVMEGAMPRFFRRLAEGVFDEDDVKRRADELADFVAWARSEYGIAAPVAVGFSNGANIAAAVLLRRPDALAGAALLRAMTPLSAPEPVDLRGAPVLMVNGDRDPIIPLADAERLAGLLTRSGARVTRKVLATGHALTREDLEIAADWLRAH
ncbi:alpha/beta hydrolase [Alsobacter sp. SYSU M60028]|uniref:Alpha/beta hydrolase n=1 Tax=Alsobacter ponti TaxID=2962936 RepID=A0ABT1LBY4_9HYPH|nr:alpha/beta hydrolase [Alsobacter ponti]MCP8939015.1 alpha/beta hydrolase [Alsobacter ponti]